MTTDLVPISGGREDFYTFLANKTGVPRPRVKDIVLWFLYTPSAHVELWRPIATCPKDQYDAFDIKMCDVWIAINGSDIPGKRITDVHWSNQMQLWVTNPQGRAFTGRHEWNNEAGDYVWNHRLTDKGSWVVTHWMPSPGNPL